MEAIIGRWEAKSTAPVPERALLVGADLPGRESSVQDSLAELGRLAETDGAEVVGTIVQRLAKPVAKTYVGSGKVAEIREAAQAQQVDVVVFDDELTPSQQNNLEQALGRDLKVLDRTALILDIFGSHATTREGRLQVELAQSQYLLPRLRGMWGNLVREQTRGGIGSRFGQGESQLEIDRRLVRNRISSLRRELAELEGRRRLQSKSRWESGVYRTALVGYTNAGKSTLLNALCGAEVYAKDELFATLDPTTRTFELEEGRRVALTDTVGFIQKLPTTLVEAFKSTLAEVLAADLVLLVADASDVHVSQQISCVLDILDEIGAGGIPRLMVYNKCDLLDETELLLLHGRDPDALMVSAADRSGLKGLLWRIAREASRGEAVLTLLIPYTEARLLEPMHEKCHVIRERYEESGVRITLRAGEQMARMLAPWVLASDENG